MLNYEVDPAVLQPLLPPYTELDTYNGKVLVSLVGFLFNNTKVFGINWPGHTNFEEVNLRYYIKHFDGKEWKRGVSFVSEIVPKPIIATTANLLYNEHYHSAKMFHTIRETPDQLAVAYHWKIKKESWNTVELRASNTLQNIIPGSEEAFIFENYFGYNKLNAVTTIEYAVEHPSWQVYPVTDFSVNCDVENLYGEAFVPFMQGVKPHSVFLAKGSAVSVRWPMKIKGPLPR